MRWWSLTLWALVGALAWGACAGVDAGAASGNWPTRQPTALPRRTAPPRVAIQSGAIYYVRPDGGDAGQCNGLADTPYSGSGVGQLCAWDHPFRALPPGGLPRMSGGDALVIAAGSYRMGLGAPGADDEAVCSVDYLTCRQADGSSCPPEDFAGCCDEDAGTCVSSRGWWSTRFDAQFLLYDPADLACVAAGELEAWEPQPYTLLDIDEHLYLDPPVWDEVTLGWGDQRRYRIGAVAYDRQNGLLYVLELYADGGKPVVHVWRVR